MKKIMLYRDSSSLTETEGRIEFDGTTLYTIERPWVPEAPGGKPFASCVPAGTYRLEMYTRQNGDIVPILTNHGLGVFHSAADRENGIGRYKILIHAGNIVANVSGCIAPGLSRGTEGEAARMASKAMVKSSRAAMKKLMDHLDGEEAELEIVGENRYEL